MLPFLYMVKIPCLFYFLFSVAKVRRKTIPSYTYCGVIAYLMFGIFFARIVFGSFC